MSSIVLVGLDHNEEDAAIIQRKIGVDFSEKYAKRDQMGRPAIIQSLFLPQIKMN
jgi:hypothetical protein